MRHTVYIALGTNLGDRLANLAIDVLVLPMGKSFGTRTDESGAFRFVDLAPTRAALTVSGPDIATRRRDVIVGTETALAVVVVRSGPRR